MPVGHQVYLLFQSSPRHHSTLYGIDIVMEFCVVCILDNSAMPCQPLDTPDSHILVPAAILNWYCHEDITSTSVTIRWRDIMGSPLRTTRQCPVGHLASHTYLYLQLSHPPSYSRKRTSRLLSSSLYLYRAFQDDSVIPCSAG